MPRGPRKTQSGAPAQTGPDIPPQTYGEGVETNALKRALPTPDYAAEAATVEVGSTATSASPAQPGEVTTHQAALDAAGALSGQVGALTQPTTRPYEPVTTGLPFGAGPGPEALHRGPSRTSRSLRELALTTGDPIWAEIAQRSRV